MFSKQANGIFLPLTIFTTNAALSYFIGSKRNLNDPDRIDAAITLFYNPTLILLASSFLAFLSSFTRYSLHYSFNVMLLLLYLPIITHTLALTTLPPTPTMSPINTDHFICNDDIQCKNNTIICNQDTNCIVDCIAAQSCQLSTIYGPQNGNLTVQCSLRACIQANIIGPKSGHLSVYCKDKVHSCRSITIQCPFYGSCHVDGASSLYSRTDHITINATNMISGALLTNNIRNGAIYCPANHNKCIVNCADYGCKDSTFYTQHDTASLDITAFGIEALKASTIYCPTGNGTCSVNIIGSGTDKLSDAKIYAVNGFDDVYIYCAFSQDDCYDVTNPPQLICNANYSIMCNIDLNGGISQCSDDLSLCKSKSNITADGYYGSYLICNDVEPRYARNPTCAHLVCVENRDCYIRCTDVRSCKNAIIIGPNTGNVKIECFNDQSCYKATIIGPNNGNLSIEAHSARALDTSTIYCPKESGHCAITANGTDVDEISGMQIYAINGLRDVSLECKSQICYDVAPTLYCRPDFSASCNIIAKSLSIRDEWECDDASIVSDLCLWSLSPTDGPISIITATPTSTPTKHPTIYTTLIPTLNPNTYPTIKPSLDPTFGPNNDPTTNPTVSPTSHPTLLPSFSPTIARHSEERIENDITTSRAEAMDESDESKNTSYSNAKLLTVLLIVIAVLFVAALIMVAYCFGKNRALKKGLSARNADIMRMTNMSSDDDVSTPGDNTMFGNNECVGDKHRRVTEDGEGKIKMSLKERVAMVNKMTVGSMSAIYEGGDAMDMTVKQYITNTNEGVGTDGDNVGSHAITKRQDNDDEVAVDADIGPGYVESVERYRGSFEVVDDDHVTDAGVTPAGEMN